MVDGEKKPNPLQAINELVNDINDMKDLPKGVKASLTAPVKQAGKILNDDNENNDNAACGKLGAFINNVNAKEKSEKLTPDEATHLRQAAENIKHLLNCKH